MESVQSCSGSAQKKRATDRPDDTQNRSVLMQETVGVCNLSSETLEAIAIKLCWKDYSAFRETSPLIAHSLPSIKEMNERIKRGLSGETAAPYKAIVNAAISDYIEKVDRGAIRDALETAKVGRFSSLRNENDGVIALLCRYPHQLAGGQAVADVLNSFCRLIPDKASIQHDRVPGSEASIIFLVCNNLASVEQLFSCANQVFKQCKGGGELVLASLINAMRLHLCGYVAEADINNLAALNPDVFSMGEIVHQRHAPEYNDVDWTEMLHPFGATV